MWPITATTESRSLPPGTSETVQKQGEGMTKRRLMIAVRVLLFGVSIALSLRSSWRLYHDRRYYDTAALLYAVSLFCLWLAFCGGVPQIKSVRQTLVALRAQRWKVLWVGLVFGVALFFRLYRFGYFPPAEGLAFEEAQAGGNAFAALRHGYRTLEFPLTAYLPALSFALWGESTLTLRLPFLILEGDALRKNLFLEPTYSLSESARLFQTIHYLIEELLEKGIPVILDATNLSERHRERIYNIAERLNARLILVRIEAPLEVVRKRLKARTQKTQTKDNSDADWTVYQKMMPTVEKIRRNHFVVDTSSDISPDLDKIVKAVNR